MLMLDISIKEDFLYLFYIYLFVLMIFFKLNRHKEDAICKSSNSILTSFKADRQSNYSRYLLC